MTTDAVSIRPVVLVVDDEPLIANTIATILTRTGYAASAVYDAESAIETALLTPPQLVISDIMLPGMNGVELGVTIRRTYPGCKVILASGHAASSILIANALLGGNHFVLLEKPVHPKVLLEYVAEILRQD